MDIIDSIEDVKQAEITFGSIRKMYGTGCALTFKNYFGEKKTHYRKGCMTAIGDIEESVWRQVVIRESETELFLHLKNWLKDSKMVFRDANDLEDYALQLHSARIFDCAEWVDYAGFNSKYRPEILHKNL